MGVLERTTVGSSFQTECFVIVQIELDIFPLGPPKFSVSVVDGTLFPNYKCILEVKSAILLRLSVLRYNRGQATS